MIRLNGSPDLQLDTLRQIVGNPDKKISLSSKAIEQINHSAAYIQDIIAHDTPIYGINTGFGKLAHVQISKEKLKLLQRNIILSHATGTGPLLDDSIVRLILAIKINSLAQGFSGVRLETLETLITLYNKKLYPCIPAKGSVGASGDLAPLAHLILPLLGEGFFRYDQKILTAFEGLAAVGLDTLELAAKEGLALVNGTQVSTALALSAFFLLENVFAAALLAGSLSLIAIHGSTVPFDQRIHEIRGQKGQIDIAKLYRELLEGYKAETTNNKKTRVQDPYSYRCQPQVMGACLDNMRFVSHILLQEANGVSDNPLVFVDDAAILTGGNFHAEPVAMAADTLALAIAEVGSLSERRIAVLIDSHMSNLPYFLVKDPGINSGFMLAHVTAAALTSENKSLAHPSSVDSIPTSANQEDHVSMATYAARRLHDMLDNTATIIAIELLAACQGLDLGESFNLPKVLQKTKKIIREKAPFFTEDRYFAPDIELVKNKIKAGEFKELFSFDKLFN